MLMWRETGPVALNGKRLPNQHCCRLHLGAKDIMHVTFEARTAPLVDNHVLWTHHLQRVALSRRTTADSYLYPLWPCMHLKARLAGNVDPGRVAIKYAGALTEMLQRPVRMTRPIS